MTTGAAVTRRPKSAPWVRTRLRTHRLSALLLAVLVLGTSFLAAALPRTLDRDADRAVARQLTEATPLARSLTARTSLAWSRATTAKDLNDFYNDEHLTRTARAIRAKLTDPLHPAPADQSAFGARSKGTRPLTGPALPRPEGLPPELSLTYLHGQEQQVRLIAGRMPAGPPTTNAPGPTPFEIALPKATADLFGVTVGAVLPTGLPGDRPGGAGPTTNAVVVGVFEPIDATAGFWSASACLTGPCLDTKAGPPPLRFWRTNALVGPGELTMLPGWASDAELFWQIPADPHGLPAHRVGQAQAVLASALDGAGAHALPVESGYPGLRLSSMLPTLLTQAQHQQSAAAALYAIGPLGAAAVALVVLLLAAGLAADRRRAELSLVRARGGSLPGIAGRLLGESAVAVLPAAALGTTLALRLLPTARWTAAVLAGVAVALLALLAFPVRAVGLLRAARPRRARTPGGRAGAARSRLGDPRRLVAELAVLAVAAAAVLAVRRRGVASPGAALDLLLSAAPLLLAVAGAVLLARGFPLLVAPAARWARGRPGALGFLGLARATRTTAGTSRGHRAPTVLPLLALLLAVTTAGFGATVLDSADAGRQSTIRQRVGADAQVIAQRQDGLPAGFADAAAKLPGVRSGTSVVVDKDASISTADGTMIAGVTLVFVDPQAYTALAGRVGVGRFDPALLDDADAAPDASVAVLAGPNLVDRLGNDGNSIELPVPYGELRVRVAGTVGGTLVLPDGGGNAPLLVVSARAVVRQKPNTAPLMANPTSWFGTGDGIEAAPLQALLTRLDRDRPGAPADPSDPSATVPGAQNASAPLYTVLTRSDYLRRLDDNPLLHAATRLFWAGVLAAAGYTVLALLLTLLRAAPERAALLARLRTMGLRPRHGLALILIEALPQALVAAVAGAGIACLAVPLLGRSVDLSAMVGATVHGGLHLALLPVARQALALAAVSAAAVFVETALTGRRQLNTELRAGDQE